MVSNSFWLLFWGTLCTNLATFHRYFCPTVEQERRLWYLALELSWEKVISTLPCHVLVQLFFTQMWFTCNLRAKNLSKSQQQRTKFCAKRLNLNNLFGVWLFLCLTWNESIVRRKEKWGHEWVAHLFCLTVKNFENLNGKTILDTSRTR